MESRYSLTHRSDIQGLRAIAILLVVLGHAHVPGFAGGFVGVDVFFVLSGFLITGILVREYRQSGRIVYTAFLARRLRRLFPALVVMLVSVMLVAPVVLAGYEFAEQTASASFAATWTSNFFFTFSDKNYFSQFQAHDLFLHTWSLGVEEQFYVLWPALLLVLLELSRRKEKPVPSFGWMLTGLGGLFVASLLVNLHWSVVHPIWSFYMVPSRIWQFAIGASIFVWTEDGKTGKEFLRNKQNELQVIGLGLIIASGLALDRNMTYPGYWALLPSIGTAMVIVSGGVRLGADSPGMLSNPVLVWIGDRSYSWYLWHWPVLILGFSWFSSPGFVVTSGLVVFSLVLAFISYRWVELPIWKGRLSNAAPVKVIPITLTVMVLAVVAFPRFHAVTGFDENSPESGKILSARSDAPVIYRLGCDSWYVSDELHPCVADNPQATKTLVLFADSVGAQWFSMLPGIYKTPPWRFIVLTKSSCPIVDEDFFYARIGKVFKTCSRWRRKAVDYLASLKPDVIYIGSDTTYGFNREQWLQGTDRILKRLAATAGEVVIVPGTDPLDIDGPGCIEKKSRKSCIRKLPAQNHVKRVSEYLQKVATKYSNVRVLPMNDLVCPNRICSAQTSSGMIVYRDNKHLTDSFVRSLIPKIREKLKKAGVIPG